MTRPALILLVLMLAAPASAGVLQVVCVAPLHDNDGTCDSVVNVPRIGPMWAHFTWASTTRGGAAGHDSLLAASGDTLHFARWVPGGIYQVVLWATDAGGVGCPTETLRTVRQFPGRIRWLK